MINSNCDSGFFCMDAIPDPWLYDGCSFKCNYNEYVVPHFATNTWQCLDIQEAAFTCAGHFNTECPDEPIPGNSNDLNSDYCDCDDQLIFSPSCKQGFQCDSSAPNGGVYKECGAGLALALDRVTWDWRCEDEDLVDCPGEGGFKLGCPSDPDPANFNCETGSNHIDTCGSCQNQIFMDSDCQSAFICSVFTSGCAMNCSAGQRVDLDLYSKDMECVPEAEVVCPGPLSIDCSSEPDGAVDIKCECDNHVWVHRNCKEAFFCSGPMTNEGHNQGTLATCTNNTQIGIIDFNKPDTFECVPDEGQCPGAFHFGCDPNEVTTTTTPRPSPTTKPTTVSSTEGPPTTSPTTPETTSPTTPPTASPTKPPTASPTTPSTTKATETSTTSRPLTTSAASFIQSPYAMIFFLISYLCFKYLMK